ADGMTCRPGVEPAAGGRIERHRADGGDRREHQHQTPVDAPQPLAERGRRPFAERYRGHRHREAIFLKRSTWREGSSFMVSTSTSRPIGPAVAPPAMPCSMITAQA